ncbi:MAG: hypothetical protein PVG53_11250 [Holophagae bacterium]|jgi:hypothetical protein
MAVVLVGPSVWADDPVGTLGPDVVVFELPGTTDWGADGGLRAYSVGTTSCNRGDEPLDWISSSNQHPVIAQNLYRVTVPDPPAEHGRIEMLGASWLKHGFVSINSATTGCGDCPGSPPGSQLGVGCTDPYSSGLNGSQSRLGPRSEVNAFTGYFEYPHSIPSGSSTLAGRLQVDAAEIVDDPSRYRYFVEGQYVAPDDAAAGNGLNNASHREVDVIGTNLVTTGATEEGWPAIYAWQTVDPAVTVREVPVPGEGHFIVAYKASDNLDGTWRYDYAVFNLNSHLSGRSFSVPIEADTVITDPWFRDVDSHSGEPYDSTDWPLTVDTANGWATWSTDAFATDPNANALRWSTMYSFGFNADSPPAPALASLEMFRSGGPPSVSIAVLAPATNLIPLFADGFETGDTSGWGAVSP